MTLEKKISQFEDSLGYTVSRIDLNNYLENISIEDGQIDFNTLRRTIESLNESKNSDSDYLQGLFNFDCLSRDDFMFVPKDSIYFYLEGYSESGDEWGEEKANFKRLLLSFKGNTSSYLHGCYLLNKEWFEVSDNKVKEREYALYSFYFVIVWLDSNNPKKVYVSEWFSD